MKFMTSISVLFLFLLSSCLYELLVEASALKNNKVRAFMEGEFKTAPKSDVPSDVNFIVTTGTSYTDVNRK